MSHRTTWLLATGLCVLVGIVAFRTGYSQAEEKEKARVYEVRTYTALPGRTEAMHARFKNHTMKLFEKHGMKNVIYCVPTDPKTKDNTLIYVLSYPTEEAAKKSWKDFLADPDWHKARDDSEKDGKIVQKAESVYMVPVDYSPHK